jgi:hypothetical membrane protein
MKKEKGPYHFVSNLIFFLNVIIALLIITGAWLLMKTEFGQNVMVFGFVLLAVSVLLKVVRLW